MLIILMFFCDKAAIKGSGWNYHYGIMILSFYSEQSFYQSFLHMSRMLKQEVILPIGNFSQLIVSSAILTDVNPVRLKV